MDVNWVEMLSFTMSPLELVLRGSMIYLFLFGVFRFILRRDVGSVGIADILILVLVADASQNAMAADYKSVPDGVVLIGTLVAWNYLFDFLSFHFPAFQKFAEPAPLCLVKDGRKLHRNMRKEYITDQELDAKMREQGVESVAEVKRAYLETNGEFTVIKKDK
jgi:uncharacterized membrane protein YcaP (DUF421 family)